MQRQKAPQSQKKEKGKKPTLIPEVHDHNGDGPIQLPAWILSFEVNTDLEVATINQDQDR